MTPCFVITSDGRLAAIRKTEMIPSCGYVTTPDPTRTHGTEHTIIQDRRRDPVRCCPIYTGALYKASILRREGSSLSIHLSVFVGNERAESFCVGDAGSGGLLAVVHIRSSVSSGHQQTIQNQRVSNIFRKSVLRISFHGGYTFDSPLLAPKQSNLPGNICGQSSKKKKEKRDSSRTWTVNRPAAVVTAKGKGRHSSICVRSELWVKGVRTVCFRRAKVDISSIRRLRTSSGALLCWRADCGGERVDF